jgi:hypothetical protein
MRLLNVLLVLLTSISLFSLIASVRPISFDTSFASLVLTRNWTGLESYLQVERKKLAEEQKSAFDKNLMLFFDYVQHEIERQKSFCHLMVARAQLDWSYRKSLSLSVEKQQLLALEQARKEEAACIEAASKVRIEFGQSLKASALAKGNLMNAVTSAKKEYEDFVQAHWGLESNYEYIASNNVNNLVYLDNALDTDTMRKNIKFLRSWEQFPFLYYDERVAEFRHKRLALWNNWQALMAELGVIITAEDNELNKIEQECAQWDHRLQEVVQKAALAELACENHQHSFERLISIPTLVSICSAAALVALEKDSSVLEQIREQFLDRD